MLMPILVVKEQAMAVYKRGYRRYQGPIGGRWARFMVLPRFAWRRLFRRRLVNLLIIVSLLAPLWFAAYIYLCNHADLLKAFNVSGVRGFLKVDRSLFATFMNVQAIFAVFLAALSGPGLIAPDLANNGLPLYFSRPLSRLDYALGRLITLTGTLSLITWIPGLILFFMQAGMAEGSWFRENWRVGTGILLGFALWTLLVSLVALASSAYAKIKVVAGGIVLGFFFLLGGASSMINLVLQSTWGNALSPSWAGRRVWYALLDVDPPAGPGALECLSVLAVIMLLLILLLERKLRPVEVIS
jgi:ABC-2 type transport system permease protein